MSLRLLLAFAPVVMLLGGCVSGNLGGGGNITTTSSPIPTEGWVFHDDFPDEVGGISVIASGQTGNWTAFAYSSLPGLDEIGVVSLPEGKFHAHARLSPEPGTVRTLFSSPAGPDAWRMVGDFQRQAPGTRFMVTSVFALAWQGGILRPLAVPTSWQTATTYGHAFFEGAHRVVVADPLGVSLWTEEGGSWVEERMPGVSNLWNGAVAGHDGLLALAALDSQSQPSLWIRRAGDAGWEKTSLDVSAPVSSAAFQVVVEEGNVTVAWSYSGVTSSADTLRVARMSGQRLDRMDVPAREYPEEMDSLRAGFLVTVPYTNATRQLWRAEGGTWQRCEIEFPTRQAIQAAPEGSRWVVAHLGALGVLQLDPGQCPPGPADSVRLA